MQKYESYILLKMTFEKYLLGLLSHVAFTSSGVELSVIPGDNLRAISTRSDKILV